MGSCCPALTGSRSCSCRASGRRQPGGLSLHPLLLVALLGPHGAGGGKIPAQRVQGDSQETCWWPQGLGVPVEAVGRLLQPKQDRRGILPRSRCTNICSAPPRCSVSPPPPPAIQVRYSDTGSTGTWWQMSPTSPRRDRGCGTTRSPSAPPAAPHSPWTDRGHHHAPTLSPPGCWCPAEGFLLVAAPRPGKPAPTQLRHTSPCLCIPPLLPASPNTPPML